MRKGLLIVGTVCLVGLVALVVASEFFSQHPRRFTGKLAEALPREAGGWVRRDIPIGASSASAASVQGILNFSQAVQAEYSKGSKRILIYIAYWEPGKVSVVDAGSHNPDSCWVNNGCVRTARQFAVAGQVAGRALIPYEFGQYLVPQAGQQNVAFWHLVNGEPNRYEAQAAGWRDGLIGRLERLPLLWKDIRQYGINQKNEQMFIRISSSMSITEIMADPASGALWQALAPLGVFVDQRWK